MSRRKRNVHLSRAERRGPPGPTPLLVIAGLPKATALAAAETINNNRNSRWRAVTTAFSDHDKSIYADPSATVELGRIACDFAIAAKKDDLGVPSPSRICVAYVDDVGSERLWDVFGHAVLPVPLRYSDWTWPKGRHWRHEIETVSRLLVLAITALESEQSESLRQRLEAHRTDDVLLLPGRNFHLKDGSRLIERFRDFMLGRVSVEDIEYGIQVKKFPYERLAEFYKRTGGRGKRFAMDWRNIVFAKSNNGQDGGQHKVPLNTEITAALLQLQLEGRYRFGTPLKPAGFQHDAQLEDGVPFHAERFDCAAKGPVEVTADHANVYPSDVVTGKISG